jgi:ATP-binding cassette subfamily B protein/ATP-binding cassette subfamily C protein/ATP-binding cassette subfamily B multidrug efflux pump
VVAGRNGAGKSTLAALIAGLEQPSHGQVLLDGLDVSVFPDEIRRTAIGLMPQNPTIVAGTMRTNIVMGREVTDDRIYRLANELALERFLTDWPGGLDGAVGEMGCNLSGGQRQKIALLRALALSPRLLVLDEPENNLDVSAVRGLVRYLEKHRGKMTVIMGCHGGGVHHLADMVIDLSRPIAYNSDSASGTSSDVKASSLGDTRGSMPSN